MTDAERLSFFHAIPLRRIGNEWAHFNNLYFRSQLKRPIFELTQGEGNLGEWSRLHRTIRLQAKMVYTEPWAVMLEVLKHEMAHQYAHEALGAIDEPPHGPAFRRACEMMGIDPAASGPVKVSADEDRTLRRVTKLLALAESPNQHEAEAAAAAAQRLMLQYNIGAPPADHSFRHLGEVSARLLEADRWLANILDKHFFVSAIWVPSYDMQTHKEGRVLEICGTAPNLELAAYVYDFLKRTAARLWASLKASGQLVGNDKQRFIAGLMRGFYEKLEASAIVCREEGLVWVGDPALDAWFSRRHPRVTRKKYGGNSQTPAYEAGREHGRELVLHKPVAGSTGGSGKLLR
jgi:hypothetical protein